MPSVPARWLETILYVYKDAESAQRSAHHGATATLISVRAEHPALRTLNLQHMYVMTNSHAVLKGAALRVNAKDGSGVDIFEIPASGWIHHQDGDDVAMAPIRQAPSQGLLAVNIDQFLTEELAVTWGIAPGDDCFFIGRHMYLDGKARNAGCPVREPLDLGSRADSPKRAQVRPAERRGGSVVERVLRVARVRRARQRSARRRRKGDRAHRNEPTVLPSRDRLGPSGLEASDHRRWIFRAFAGRGERRPKFGHDVGCSGLAAPRPDQ
jgi:hypothetical protein